MSVDILGTNCDQCQSTVQCCFTSTETVRLIRTGAQDSEFDFHTAPELCMHTDPVSIAHFDRPGWRVVVLTTVQR